MEFHESLRKKGIAHFSCIPFCPKGFCRVLMFFSFLPFVFLGRTSIIHAHLEPIRLSRTCCIFEISDPGLHFQRLIKLSALFLYGRSSCPRAVRPLSCPSAAGESPTTALSCFILACLFILSFFPCFKLPQLELHREQVSKRRSVACRLVVVTQLFFFFFLILGKASIGFITADLSRFQRRKFV